MGNLVFIFWAILFLRASALGKQLTTDICGNPSISRPVCQFSEDIRNIYCGHSDTVHYAWKDPEDFSGSFTREITCRSSGPIYVSVGYWESKRMVISTKSNIRARKIAGNATFEVRIPFGLTTGDTTKVKYYKLTNLKTNHTLALSPAFFASTLLGALDLQGGSNASIIASSEWTELPCIAVGTQNPEGVYRNWNYTKEEKPNLNESATFIPVDNNGTGTLHWDFVTGFRMKTVDPKKYEGNYLCNSKTGLQRTPTLVAKYFTLQKPPDFSVSPNNSKIDLFTFSTTVLHLRCMATFPVVISQNVSNTIPTEYQSTHNPVKGLHVVEVVFGNMTPGDKGVAICSPDGVQNDWFNDTHVWEISVMDLGERNSDFTVTRDGKKAICGRWKHNWINEIPILKNLACNSPQECSTLEPCLKKNFFCDNIVQTGRPCDYLGCSKLIPFSAGLIMCEDIGPILYFQGFDGLLYHKWQDAPLDAVLSVTMASQISPLYTNEKFQFTCEARRFLSNGDFSWGVKYKNGSTVTDFTFEVLTSTLELDVVAVATIYIDSSEINEIVCMAPEYATGEWVNKSLKVNVTESTIPFLRSQDLNPRFRVGDNNAAIKCMFQSFPKPEVVFYRDNASFQDLLQQNFTVLFPAADSASLLFPEFSEALAGTYYCSAANVAGESILEFTVNMETDDQKIGLLIGIGVAIFTIFLVFAFIIDRWRDRVMHRRVKELMNRLSEMEVKQFFEGAEDQQDSTNDDSLLNPDAIPYDRNYDIEKDRLVIEKSCPLGVGEFGVVFKATYQDNVVAVKSTKPSCPAQQIRSLLSELKLHIYIGKHENIVSLIGSYVEEIESGSAFIVLEFCPLGNLLNYLRNTREFLDNLENIHNYTNASMNINTEERYHNVFIAPLTLTTIEKDMSRWCLEIANAMLFLGTKKIIHSDLAARNVLLAANKTAKLTDFGLSRKLYNYTQYVKQKDVPLPWRWMAPESLRELKFSVDSDVWSYGIVMWEIYSLGTIPYPGKHFDIDFIKLLEQGLRPRQPEFACNEIYDQMKHCWKKNPNERTSFPLLVEFFNNWNRL